MKFRMGRLLLSSLHFERLFQSLRLLQIDLPPGFDALALEPLLAELCRRNGCMQLARVRLAVFRNAENKAEYIAEAIPLDQNADRWQEAGLSIDIYPYARKSQDAFASLKTANYLPYVLAARFAEARGLDDVLVLNASNRICDSSKANVFLLRGGELYTPPTSEGCVQGVMRRHLLQFLKNKGFIVHQHGVEEKDLEAADEIFLTNAIIGLRSVRSFREKQYPSRFCAGLYHELLPTIYEEDC